MLRIHFTSADLIRVRFLSDIGPLMESWFSLTVLRAGTAKGLFAPWTRNVKINKSVRLLAALTALTYPLDVFTVVGDAPTPEEGLERLQSARTEHLREELEGFDADVPLPSWTRNLASDPDLRRNFAAAVHDAHAATVAPYRTAMRARTGAEFAARGEEMLLHGVEHLLASLHPTIGWDSMVLSVSPYPHPTTDVHLNGRGLVLAPSIFCLVPVPSFNAFDRDASPVLFYPALRDPGQALAIWRRPSLEPSEGGAGRSLAALLGDTRAAALEFLASGCTTTQLAVRLGVSAATASHHASILRHTGLITTRRQGGSVWHTATPLGFALLSGHDLASLASSKWVGGSPDEQTTGR
ncbi:winged helix-turn-helix transcriptional regulator [Nonomuraea sp. NN258]|uniref:ArsR/SmtB family transcription factor n=1 Tax=Nonomuraea antri TaxID=2730852 RepID=UPI00156981C9|nr:winged helix-turn-helix domain-containing protein [Nonomuraea antri]NRQ34482.1 winged helix-turn-helix transcriptional regulator [Nonomuraea antri]